MSSDFRRSIARARGALVLSLMRAAFLTGHVVAPEWTVRRACCAFCTPFAVGRMRARQAADGDARSDEITVGGDRIALYRWGDPAAQPYVLFAHGWSSFGLGFLPWVRPLREAGYAVVAFDQTAHGRSGGTRATLPVFVRTLLAVAARYRRAEAVVGHSLGAAATAVALARGLPADRAVLISPSADLAAAANRFTTLMRLPESFYGGMLAAFERNGIQFDALQAQANAPRIGRPALIVHDLEDREIPWAEGERYARYWPDARLLTTRDLTHGRIATDQAVIAAGLRFLRGEHPGERVVSSPNLPYGIA